MEYNKESLEKIINESSTFCEVLKKFNRNTSAASYRGLKKKISIWNIKTDHFLDKKQLIEKQRINNQIISKVLHDEIFIENSKVAQATLRRRILDENLIEYFCKLCGSDDTWRGQKFSLILDHINGIRNDNRIFNLRFLCPNCNATLKTHCKGYIGLINMPL